MKKQSAYAIGAIGLLGALALMMGAGGEPVDTGDGDDDDDDDDDDAKDTPGPKKNKRKGKVPARSSWPYNDTKFTEEAVVRAYFAGLTPKFGHAIVASQAQYKEIVRQFQKDWNALANADVMTPTKLNKSALRVDGVPGWSTLRALEWALPMNWPQKLSNTGRGV